MARTGKIASLPFEVQEILNHRLLNNERGPTLLPWLNSLVEVQEVINRDWEGEPVTDSNLSNWRTGGFEDWKKERAEVFRIRALNRHFADIADAGQNVFAGLSAQLADKLSLLFSAWTPEQQTELLESPKSLIGLLSAAASLQTAQVNEKRLTLDSKKLAQKDTELQQRERDLERREKEMRWRLANQVLDAVKTPEVQELLTSNRPKSAILPDLVAALFPDPMATANGGATAA